MDYQTLAEEFVRTRDLYHCSLFCDVGQTRQSFTEEFDAIGSRAVSLAEQDGSPDWVRNLVSHYRHRDIESWHAACQGVDRYWPTYEQGKQARRLGIPRDAGIHSTLDDGFDTLTPWLCGWDHQQADGGNPPVFTKLFNRQAPPSFNLE